MKNKVITLALIAAVVGCAPVVNRSADGAINIKATDFDDYYLTIMADDKIEQYFFSGDGTASSWRGDEEGVLNITYNWQIVDNQTILLTAKKGLDGPVYNKTVIEGYPFLSEINKDGVNLPKAKLKTIHLQFRDITSNRAYTMDGKSFNREKIRL